MSDAPAPPPHNLATILHEVEASWRSAELTPSGGATEAEIADFEARYSLRFPADFRQYLCQLNGVVGGHHSNWDGKLFSFWPLAAMQPVSEDDGSCGGLLAERLVIFADWNLRGLDYAVLCGGDPNRAPVYLLASHPYRLTDSFQEFLSAYLRDDDLLYGPRLRSSSQPAA